MIFTVFWLFSDCFLTVFQLIWVYFWGPGGRHAIPDPEVLAGRARCASAGQELQRVDRLAEKRWRGRGGGGGRRRGGLERMMNFVFKMMDFVFKMIDFALEARGLRDELENCGFKLRDAGEILTDDGFCTENDGFCTENDGFILIQDGGFHTRIDELCTVARAGAHAFGPTGETAELWRGGPGGCFRCVKNDELCIKNEGLCIKNEGFCILNDEFCRAPETEGAAEGAGGRSAFCV